MLKREYDERDGSLAEQRGYQMSEDLSKSSVTDCSAAAGCRGEPSRSADAPDCANCEHYGGRLLQLFYCRQHDMNLAFSGVIACSWYKPKHTQLVIRND
jgi:hypothetical protein